MKHGLVDCVNHIADLPGTQHSLSRSPLHGRSDSRPPFAEDAFPLILLCGPASEPDRQSQKYQGDNADCGGDQLLQPTPLLTFAKLPSTDKADEGDRAEVEEA